MLNRILAASLTTFAVALTMPAMGQAPASQVKPATPASASDAKAAAATAEDTPHYLNPETPEKRKERLGMAEDPGTDPDLTKHYSRFGKMMHIERFDKRWASFAEVEPGRVRPFGFLNFTSELYQLNEKYVWVWVFDHDPVAEAASAQALATELSNTEPGGRHFRPEEITYFEKIRGEFTQLTPAASSKVVRFEESSNGLPTSGSWRNSCTVADMNEDGFLDIIAPPERAGSNLPVIYLGDGKGNWKFWSGVKWPRALDYGSVVAADFNKDGHMDLAFGVHLTGVKVFLGDGKGHFTESSEGLPKNFPTRRVMVADVDHDGYPDLVAISEGPTGVKVVDSEAYGRLRVMVNREKGTKWEGVNISSPDNRFGGDWLAMGKFNSDDYPDFIGASVFFNSTGTGFLSSGKLKWNPMSDEQGTVVPYMSYYFANTAGRFSSKTMDDAIVSYARFWPGDLSKNLVPTPPITGLVGIDRLSFSGGKVKRTPIVRWDSNRAVWGLATGDFDGDGNLDIIYTRYDPREAVILLGDGKGGFARARLEGIPIPSNTNYDIKIADVNGDGRPDVIVMYESASTTSFASRDGSMHVYLNQGPAPATTVAK